jgi:hypothetical protein
MRLTDQKPEAEELRRLERFESDIYCPSKLIQ